MNNVNEFLIIKSTVNKILVDITRYGVRIDKVDCSPFDGISQVKSFFISVPKSSHMALDNGEEACDAALAKYVKKTFIEEFKKACDDALSGEEHNPIIAELATNMTHNDTYFKVKFKVRDEVWTRQDEERATLLAMQSVMMCAK